MTDLYADLGISRTATPAEVKAAYRKASKEAHPDTPTGSQEKFERLRQAYNVLSDAKLRKHYDMTGTFEIQEPDNREAHAREIVASCITNVLKASEQGEIAEDIFAGMSERVIRPQMQKIIADKERWQRNIARNAKMLAKVKHKKKGSANLVKAIMDGMTAELHRNIARADEAIAIHERAIEIMAEYEYEFEKQQQVQLNARTGSFFHVSSW